MSSLFATATVVHEGWLLKKGEYIATWRPRYFQLKSDGTFRGYKGKPAPGEGPINLFEIRGCSVVLEEAKGGKFGFTIRFIQMTRIVERSFHTEVASERDEWIAAIEKTKQMVESRGTAEEIADKMRAMSFIGPRPVPIEMSLEDFDMMKVLGKGTFGKVMLAKLKRTEELFAIKILKKSMVLEKDELAHTLTENSVLAKCNHTFLTSLAYSFQTPDLLCFVMEYVNGGELFFHLRKDKRFSEERTRFYISEILLALTYLHSQSIIYRDLKLENLMLDKHGHIKITDFGLCKEEIAFGSTTSTFCGTPEYLAPEVIVDSDYGRAVDWWGMGVVMFEMLTGKLPFSSKDYEQLFNLILTQEVHFPEIVAPAAKDLLSQLLCKDPIARLGSGPDDGKEIQAHKWFESVDFPKMEKREIKPPFIPTITAADDTANFDPYFTSEAPNLTPPENDPIPESEKESAFKGFTAVVKK